MVGLLQLPKWLYYQLRRSITATICPVAATFAGLTQATTNARENAFRSDTTKLIVCVTMKSVC